MKSPVKPIFIIFQKCIFKHSDEVIVPKDLFFQGIYLALFWLFFLPLFLQPLSFSTFPSPNKSLQGFPNWKLSSPWQSSLLALISPCSPGKAPFFHSTQDSEQTVSYGHCLECPSLPSKSWSQPRGNELASHWVLWHYLSSTELVYGTHRSVLSGPGERAKCQWPCSLHPGTATPSRELSFQTGTLEWSH
mgnify:CR=1 FL=1